MLNITTMSAKKALKPGERNYLMINLDFRTEVYQEEKDNCVVFIIDNGPNMMEFVGRGRRNTTKYQYAIDFILGFTKKMSDKDSFAVIKMSDEKNAIIPLTKDKNISKLYKTYPNGYPDLFFSLTNAKTILDKANDNKYNKSIIILSDTEVISQYDNEAIMEKAKEFYKSGIKISTISLNECADLGILSIATKGNYYSLESKKHFDRIIHKELWSPSFLMARNVEIIISRNPNLEFEYNLEGFTQKVNKNKSISIFIGKSFGHTEIIIPYIALEKQGMSKFDIKIKYRGDGSDTIKKSKVQEEIEIKKRENILHRYENESVVYKSMFELRNYTFAKIDRMLNKRIYGDAIDELNQYIYQLNNFSNFASAVIATEKMTEEAKKKIKELKRRIRVLYKIQ